MLTNKVKSQYEAIYVLAHHCMREPESMIAMKTF